MTHAHTNTAVCYVSQLEMAGDMKVSLLDNGQGLDVFPLQLKTHSTTQFTKYSKKE